MEPTRTSNKNQAVRNEGRKKKEEEEKKRENYKHTTKKKEEGEEEEGEEEEKKKLISLGGSTMGANSGSPEYRKLSFIPSVSNGKMIDKSY